MPLRTKTRAGRGGKGSRRVAAHPSRVFWGLSLLHGRRACSQSRRWIPQAGPHLDGYTAGIMKDQRELFGVTQQQLLEEEQRVPSLTVKDRAQDRDPRQISLSTDIKRQALGFNCCRAAGGAEENSLVVAITRFPFARQ